MNKEKNTHTSAEKHKLRESFDLFTVLLLIYTDGEQIMETSPV